MVNVLSNINCHCSRKCQGGMLPLIAYLNIFTLTLTSHHFWWWGWFNAVAWTVEALLAMALETSSVRALRRNVGLVGRCGRERSVSTWSVVSMASLQEPEIQFAQKLASNEKSIRTKAIKKLRKYINVRSQKATGKIACARWPASRGLLTTTQKQ